MVDNKTKTTGQTKAVDKTEKSVFPKGNAPALCATLKGIVPEPEHESFMQFVSKRPRVLDILGKAESNEEDRENLRTAYNAFEQEKRKTALVKSEAVSLAVVLGMPQQDVEGYLEIYDPDQLRDLGRLAQTEGISTRDVIETDVALLKDGSYSGRRKETITVSMVHGELLKLINSELERNAGQEAIRAEDENFDNAWEQLVEKHKGDHGAAAKEYEALAKAVLTGKKKEAKFEPFQLSTDSVVELFKLFNYDQGDILEFLEYAKSEFSLVGVSRDEITKLLFRDLICDFIRKDPISYVLNQRSKYYNKARAVQMKAQKELESPPERRMDPEDDEAEPAEEKQD